MDVPISHNEGEFHPTGEQDTIWDKLLEEIRETLRLLYSIPSRNEVISLRSSDRVVYRMEKSAATAESEVLKDVIDFTGGGGEIPVDNVSGGILSKAIAFCQNKHGFHNAFNSLVDCYKSWVKGFVNNNRSILSDLHQAADFLNIQSLLDLTSRAVGDMMGRSVEEISEWYARLSLSQMLSPLGLGGDVHNQGGGGPPMPLVVH